MKKEGYRIYKKNLKLLLSVILIGLFIFCFIYFLRQEKIDKVVNLEIQKCIDEALVSGLQLIGLQGGSLISGDLLPVDGLNIAYYSFDNFILLNEIENNLDLYIESSIQMCGEDVVFDSIKSKTSIRNRDIFNVVNVNILNNGKKVGKDYKSKLDINFNEIYSVAKEILKTENNDLDYLSGFGFDIIVIPYEEKYIYSIRDINSLLDGIPYTFRFGRGERNE